MLPWNSDLEVILIRYLSVTVNCLKNFSWVGVFIWLCILYISELSHLWYFYPTVKCHVVCNKNELIFERKASSTVRPSVYLPVGRFLQVAASILWNPLLTDVRYSPTLIMLLLKNRTVNLFSEFGRNNPLRVRWLPSTRKDVCWCGREILFEICISLQIFQNFRGCSAQIFVSPNSQNRLAMPRKNHAGTTNVLLPLANFMMFWHESFDCLVIKLYVGTVTVVNAYYCVPCAVAAGR